MRLKKMNWLFWLLEPEDTSNTDSKPPPHLKTRGNKNKLLSFTKILLWYGVGILIGLSIARLH